MVRYGFIVDLKRCTGCMSCTLACKVENNTPKAAFWMHVFKWEEGKYPHVQVKFFPRPCMHCDNPPCAKVCPTGARYKRDDGFVLTDFERCIGCRYCETACPYGVNYFNWKHPADNQYYDWKGDEGKDVYGTGSIKEHINDNIPPYKNPDANIKWGREKRLTACGSHFIGVMEKCTWCVHRVEKGLLPACVTNCPVRTFHFGDLDDPNSEVSKILQKEPWFRLLEEQGTKPRVYYIGGLPPPHSVRQLGMEMKV